MRSELETPAAPAWTWRPFALAALVALGCASRSSAPASSATTVDPETGTTVVVSRDPAMEANPICVRYCARVAECWSSVPNADPMLNAEQAESRCLQEQDQCRTEMTDSHCCVDAADCDAFSTCLAESTGELSGCGQAAP